MADDAAIGEVLARRETRLDRMEEILEGVRASTRKSLEWVGMWSEHLRSLDELREEVRASLEPVVEKLHCTDEVIRILRHATADVSRRIEGLEEKPRIRA